MNTQADIPQLFDVEIEQAILGLLMVQPRAFSQIVETVRPEHFYDALHRHIYAALVERLGNDQAVDPVSVAGSLKPMVADLLAEGQLDLPTYLGNLAVGSPAITNIGALGQMLVDWSQRRKLAEVARDTLDRAHLDHKSSAADIADEASEALYLATRAEGGDAAEPIYDVAYAAAKRAADARARPDTVGTGTGIAPIDKALGGFFRKDFYVLAAPPSAGKSGLVAQFGVACAQQGKPCLFFSKEMSREDVGARMLGLVAGVPSNRIVEGRTSEAEIERVVEAARTYADLPLIIDDSPRLTVSQMRARSQAVRRKHGDLGLVIVDHLAKVQPEDPRSQERERLAQISRDLKTMAKDLNTSVLLISAMNRDVWKRQVQRPVVSDIYGASAIEYDADHIWFLYREEYFLERMAPPESDAEAHAQWLSKMEAAHGVAELYSAKRRNGPVGNARLGFDAPLVRFFDPEAEVDFSSLGRMF